MSESLRGNCLVAAKSLRDPNFYKTVVLLLEHGEQGATGLIVNRPSSIKVSDALSGAFSELPQMEDVVFVGGPVEPGALLMLHNADIYQDSDTSPVPGLYIGGSAASFEQVLLNCGGVNQPHFRIFSGYSGWGPDQLEGEIERGDWLMHPGCCDLLFRADPYEVYDLVLQKIYESNRLLPYDAKHAQWN
jgi:putative transcriptional regulator